MDLRPKGIPWDQETYKRIERKGGCHYKSTVADYIDLERKIEAHELRYADRVEVYGDQVYNGMRITDCVVVLNGGQYMSTGIKAPEAPANERVHSDGRTEQARYDSVSVTGSGRQVEEDEDATDINPNRPTPHSNYPPSAVPEHVSYSGDRKVYPALSEADEAMRVSLGMTRPQWDEWNHGGGWSDPKPIDPADLRKTAIYFAGRAEYHRKVANVWLGVAAACLLLMVGVLFIPTGWIFMLFEAFQ